MISDLILGAWAAVLGVGMVRRGWAHAPSRLWGLGWLTTAAAAWLGAWFHHLPKSAGSGPMVWDITLILCGACVGFQSAAALSGSLGRREAHTRWFYAGVGVILLAVGVQRTGWALGPSLDHNALFHLMVGVGLYLFFRGARSYAPHRLD